MRARPDLKIRTREVYAWLLEKYLVPTLGRVPLAKLTPTLVRSWHAELVRTAKPTPTRQAYSLLRAMLNTAVADELIQRNPCIVRGAGVSRTAERTVATIAQVNALADAVPPRYRMLILLAAWSGARWGELVALTRDSLEARHDHDRPPVRRTARRLPRPGHTEDRRGRPDGPHPTAPARRAPGAPGHVDHRGLAGDLPQWQGRADPPGLLAIGVAARAGQSRPAAVPLPTTCGTRATRWPRRPAPAPRS